MKFLNVPAGTYRIGTTAEGVEKCVRDWRGRLISACYSPETFKTWIEKEFPDFWVRCQSFEMSQTLVTNAQAQAYLAETSAQPPESISSNMPDDHPVWGVSFAWARHFAEWLSHRDARYTYRLPSETEWEVAARGDDFREYPYGHEFNVEAANTVENRLGQTTSVDHYQRYPGPFGHYDLAGNVEEWVATPYWVYPGGKVICDDLYERFGLHYPILRGGSFCCGGDLSRSARRHGPFPDPKFRYTGFRLVRNAK